MAVRRSYGKTMGSPMVGRHWCERIIRFLVGSLASDTISVNALGYLSTARAREFLESYLAPRDHHSTCRQPHRIHQSSRLANASVMTISTKPFQSNLVWPVYCHSKVVDSC